MDPITTAIVAALPALATEMVSSTVKDAYAGLKSLIVRRFGGSSLKGVGKAGFWVGLGSDVLGSSLS